MKKPSSVTLGIDLGGTNFTVAVMDASGRLLAKSKSETLASRGPADLIARLAAESLKVSAASGVKPGRIKALGIGSPGPLDAKRGLVLDPPNLPGWRRVPLTRLMARKTGFKVFLDNDANAAALGETVFGAGRGFSEVIAITLGTGVGGGIVLGGKIYSGPDSTAGELGHMSLDPKGPLCNCGQRGCLEQYASATAIARRAAQLVALARRGPLWKLCQGRPALVTGKMAHQALRLGDASAKKTWAEASWALGSAIGSILNIFNPERVILAGGVMSTGDELLAEARKQALARAFPQPARRVRIVKALLGADAGVMGAAEMARRAFEAP